MNPKRLKNSKLPEAPKLVMFKSKTTGLLSSTIKTSPMACFSTCTFIARTWGDNQQN
ncbi:unnamed protein product [marine sediment metagenome]|uniref:Uncharacterized protein n=1 Tax=marine sediment metagenome TaxID=412755 RepID=X1G4E5_9ZZZZ